MQILPSSVHFPQNVGKSVSHLEFLSIVRGSASEALHHRSIACLLRGSKTFEIFHLELRVGEVMESLIEMLEEVATPSEAVNVVSHGLIKEIKGPAGLDRLVELFVHHMSPATDVFQDLLFFLIQLLVMTLNKVIVNMDHLLHEDERIYLANGESQLLPRIFRC